MVSIITPSYNSSKFVSETIESVINQTYKDWEMLIVDDSSIDDSVSIIESIAKNDERIKLIKLETNVGAAEARNVALREAKGKYIAFLDSDDFWEKDKLKIQRNFMESKDIAFSFSNYVRINKDGNYLNTIHVPNTITYKQYLRNTIIGTLTVMINKEKTGYFEMPNIRSSHDMALWCDIFKRGFIGHGLKEVLGSYRVLPTSNTAKKFTAALDVWKVYREIEKLSVLRSIFNFIGYSLNVIIKNYIRK